MARAKLGLLILAVTFTSGCMTGPSAVSRNETSSVVLMTSAAAEEHEMRTQAAALDEMTRDLMRKATTKGAVIGAVAGCGLAAMTGAGKNKCLGGAVAGGVVGGIIGNARGKKQVQERFEVVSLSRVMPSVQASKDQMELVRQGIPSMLSAQEKEINALQIERDAGRISKDTFDNRINEIRENRRAVAHSLSLSADQSSQALNALKRAEAEGQDGLSWYIHTVSGIEEDAVSARSSISLL